MFSKTIILKKITMKYVTAIILFFGVSCLSCSLDFLDYSKDDRIKRIVDLQSGRPINEYMIYRAPSYPKKISRFITEVDPVEAIVVALPYQDAITNEDILSFYMTIIKRAIRITDVILLVDERELSTFKEILSQLVTQKLDRYLDGKQGHMIKIVQARFNTKWIRDYGPIFVVDAQGEICLTDAIYSDVRIDIRPPKQISVNDFFTVDVVSILGVPEDENEIDFRRYEDDSMSMYLANYLYQKHGHDIQIIRLPVQLQGGDVFGDGENNLFISSESLLLNGGHRFNLELILKAYYGIKTITYLEPFPGDTIKHLDMLFKPIGSDLFLVADYPANVKDEDFYMQYLHQEIKQVLDYNVRILKEKFPERHIVRVPMPPVERSSVLNDSILDLTRSLFISNNYPVPSGLISEPERWGIDDFVYLCYMITQYNMLKSKDELSALLTIFEPYQSNQFSSEYEAVLSLGVSKLLDSDPQLLAWIAESYRSDLKGTGCEDMTHEKLLEKVLDDYIKTEEEGNPEYYSYLYRSYLNATYINGSSGRMLLVPSYSDYEEIERQVCDIYQELFPDTEIVFVNSDEIIKQYGAVHCATITVPDFRRK